MAMELTAMQQAAIDHRDSAMLISAGAGSGKTRVLIERLMGLIEQGTDVDRFLVITYTRAAAAELRSRLSGAISERLAKDPGNRLMRRQAALIYRARINTIHAFCSDVIRENAHIAGVRPDFRQMDEAEAAALLRETLEELIERRYQEMDEDFRLLTDMLGAGRDDSRLIDMVLETRAAVQSHPYPERWIQEQLDIQIDPAADAGSTPWGELLLRRAGRRARSWQKRMEAELPGLEADEGTRKAYLPSWQETAASIAAFAEAIENGWDAACAFGDVAFPRLGAIRGRGEDEYILGLKAIREACKDAMKKLSGDFSVASAGLMADMAAIKPVTDSLYRLVLELDGEYAAAKKRRGALDFGDLEHLSLQILTDPEQGGPSPVAGEISRRFAEILVDEYQDVNRVQEMIFAAVSDAGRNVTMVGDVKQSIYRFRLADPGIFLEKYSSFAEYPAPKGEPVRIRMAHNFRSRPEILELVNRVFSRLMSEELGEMSYGSSEAMIPGRTDPGAFSEPVEICLCQPPEEGRVEYEARCAAAYIRRLLDSGAEVEGRPIRSSDCAILLRSPSSAAAHFLAALEKLGIPASVAGGSSGLFDGFENSCLLSILRVIDNPVQDIPLIAALRSPVWQFSADELAHIRAAAPGDFYSALKARAENDEKCAAFLAELGELRELAASLPADSLISAVLAKTGLPAIAEARQAGAAERLYLVQSYARSCEDSGCRGLYGFLARIDSSEPPKLSKSAENGVSIMSVHSSKGLEFPVVLLCDLSHRFNLLDARKALLIHRDLGAGPKFTDMARGIEYPTLARSAIAARINSETLSEELRVLYVALTRPREKLVCFCSAKNIEEYLAKLRLGLSDPPAADILEERSCPGDWLLTALLCDPDFRYTIAQPDGVCAGAMETTEEEHAAEAPDAGLAEELRASLSWRAAGNSSDLPSKVTATALKSGFRSAEASENAEEIAPVVDERRDILRRPGFVAGEKGLSPTERGTALHMAMQLVDFSRCGSAEEIQDEIRRMEALRLLTPAQAASVDPEILLRFFRSELGRRALAAERLEREFKFSVLLPAASVYGRGEGEVLLQGVIDLFFEEADGIVLVDFKSDRITEAGRQARAEEYAGQLNAYAEALSRITGRKIKEKRLFFFACDQ